MEQSSEPNKQKQWNDYTPREKLNTKILLIGAGLFLLLFIISLINGGGSSQSVADNPIDDKDVRNLDLKIYAGSAGLTIKNKEKDILTNCEVEINSGYFRRSTITSDKEVSMPYSLFVKDTERFDVERYAVKKIVVDRCENFPDRIGIYEFD